MGLIPGRGFPGDSDGKGSVCSAGDQGLIPGQEDPLEKGMATQSSILAWRIPWTEEPTGYSLKCLILSRNLRSQSEGHTENWQKVCEDETKF